MENYDLPLTVSLIAKKLGVTRQAITMRIQRRGIEAVGRYANANVYDKVQVALISAELVRGRRRIKPVDKPVDKLESEASKPVDNLPMVTTPYIPPIE